MKSSIAHGLVCKEGKNLKAALRASLLLARKNNLPAEQHIAQALTQRVQAVLDQHKPQCVGFYWPLNGEFDARPVLLAWLSQSAKHSAALPVVTDLAGALAFYRWSPEAAMIMGRFQIPVPAEAVEVKPDLLLIPCLGFDHARYRLGYGGGFYDRTLANASSPLLTVGIAYECGHVNVLPREAHDMPLDLIISEAAQYE